MTAFRSGDPLDIRVSGSRLNNGGGNWFERTTEEARKEAQLGFRLLF